MTPSTDDVPAGLSKHRIEALADGIFAVAMTLLVLALVFYSPRLALYLYLALPLLHMLPGRLDRMTMPSSTRRRRSP